MTLFEPLFKLRIPEPAPVNVLLTSLAPGNPIRALFVIVALICCPEDNVIVPDTKITCGVVNI
jgi:hypothetical protein